MILIGAFCFILELSIPPSQNGYKLITLGERLEQMMKYNWKLCQVMFILTSIQVHVFNLLVKENLWEAEYFSQETCLKLQGLELGRTIL